MPENINKNVITIISKMFIFLRFHFVFQPPLGKTYKNLDEKHFRFILKPELETVSLLTAGTMTVQIIHSSFSLLPFICIAQPFFVKML